MVAGHLQEKKGYFYVVLNYKDSTGKRKSKWIPTQLPVKGNKKKAEKLLMEHRRLFVPDDQPLTDDILFSDFMIQWLEIIRPTVAIATYAGYHNTVTKIIVPYFKGRAILLSELKPTDIQTFYSEQLKRVTASEGAAASAEVVNGCTAISIQLDDLNSGSYRLMISAFVGEKKAEQPLNINGNWECEFSK